MIDRWKLENGSLSDRLDQLYALSSSDIQEDPSIIDILKRNLTSTDDEILEISIMRLGMRSRDVSSIEPIMSVLSWNRESLVRSAAIRSLSVLHDIVAQEDENRAADILCTLSKILSAPEELKLLEKEFKLTQDKD